MMANEKGVLQRCSGWWFGTVATSTAHATACSEPTGRDRRDGPDACEHALVRVLRWRYV